MKKQINTIIMTAALAMTTTIFAETCPNLDGKKFNSLAEYNQFKNSVAANYSLPDMNGEPLSFPITLGKTEYAYMESNSKINQSAPFTGNKLYCYISWTSNVWEQFDGIITINHNVKSTSSDWDAMDDQTAECQHPSGDNTCTFDRIA